MKQVMSHVPEQTPLQSTDLKCHSLYIQTQINNRKPPWNTATLCAYIHSRETYDKMKNIQLNICDSLIMRGWFFLLGIPSDLFFKKTYLDLF